MFYIAIKCLREDLSHEKHKLLKFEGDQEANILKIIVKIYWTSRKIKGNLTRPENSDTSFIVIFRRYSRVLNTSERCLLILEFFSDPHPGTLLRPPLHLPQFINFITNF